MIYLELAYLSLVRTILEKHLPEKKVMVFGSRVKGQIKPYSDLDLCIMGQELLSIDKIANLREDFSNSDLPMRVDLVEWAGLTPDFQMLISEQGELI